MLVGARVLAATCKAVCHGFLLGWVAVATNRLERANHMPTTFKRLLGLHAADRRIHCLAFDLMHEALAVSCVSCVVGGSGYKNATFCTRIKQATV